MKRSIFLRIFRRSLVMRKGKVIIASASVMLAVTVITGMLAITMGIGEKLGSELRAYGANIMVSPPHGEYLAYDDREKISQIQTVEDVSAHIFGRAMINEASVEVIGLDVKGLEGKGWRLDGLWPTDKGEVIAGTNLRNALGIERGETLTVRSGHGMKKYYVTGFHERGGTEDTALMMSLNDAWDLLGSKGTVSAFLVDSEPLAIDTVIEEIQARMPGMDVKTVRQVAVAEQSLLQKMQLLMLLVTIVVLVASGIGVASTMGATVLERREEIGLMKAIGGSKKQISLFYIVETGFIGITGGIGGFLFGSVISQVISKGAFGSYINLSVTIPIVSLLTGLVFSLLAGYYPVTNALKYNPAVILREE